MSSIQIRILGVGESAILSIGGIVVESKGDVIVYDKSFPGHQTRHKSGESHFRNKDGTILPIRQGLPLDSFSGLEYLGTHIFSVENLPLFYQESRVKKSEGIFAIDLRAYEGASLNMAFAILTYEGIPELVDLWKPLGKKQFYVYESSHPMIAIKVADAREVDLSKISKRFRK